MTFDGSSARIGMVNFINTAPFYTVWCDTVNKPEWRIVEDTPAVLNRMLCNGELDMGIVSSHEYALHPEKYRILTNVSISSSGRVGSVCLFSSLPPDKLTRKSVLLSPQSQTSNSLIQIILEEFYRVQPLFVRELPSEDVEAVLAIGDEALRIASSNKFTYTLDLGEEWQRFTGLPFVFAVWAITEDFCRQNPQAVAAIQYELLRCIAEGRKELAAISETVAQRIPMAPGACYEYLCGIEYDLTPVKEKSLKKFYEYLIARGECSQRALPIKFCCPQQ